MNEKDLPYVHVLVFQCKHCNGPLLVPVVTEASNLEKVDGDTFDVECQCGWWKRLLGVEAARHWVAPWMAVPYAEHLRAVC